MSQPLIIHPGGLYIEPVKGLLFSKNDKTYPDSSICKEAIDNIRSAHISPRQILLEKSGNETKRNSKEFFSKNWILDVRQIPLLSNDGYVYVMTIVDTVSNHILNWSVSNAINPNWYNTVIAETIRKSPLKTTTFFTAGTRYTDVSKEVSVTNVIIIDSDNPIPEYRFNDVTSNDKTIIYTVDGVNRYIGEMFWDTIIQNHFIKYFAKDVLEVYCVLAECFSRYKSMVDEQSQFNRTLMVSDQYEYVEELAPQKRVLVEKATAHKRFPFLRNWKMYSFNEKEVSGVITTTDVENAPDAWQMHLERPGVDTLE